MLTPEMRSRDFAYSDVFRHPPIDGAGFLSNGQAREDLPEDVAPLIKNESNCTVFLKDGTWLTTWGQGRAECHRDQKIVCALSRDMGKTWSSPVTVAPRKGDTTERAAYGIPFAVPETNRIYVFYFGTTGDGADPSGQQLRFTFSDDRGQTWAKPRPIALPERSLTGQDTGQNWVNHPPVRMPGGEVVFTFSAGARRTQPWQLGAAEVSVVRCDNILEEREPESLGFTVLPAGPRGIRTAVEHHWDNPALQRHLAFWDGVPEETGWSFQEMTIVPLSGHRWLGIGRTYLGAPGYTLSTDHGQTWTRAEPLCFGPDGPPIPHPMTMCPIARTSDGSFVLLFTNNDGSRRGARHAWDGDGHTRNPQWFVVGRESPGESRNAGIEFGEPRMLCEVDDGGEVNLKTGISMPQFFEREGRYFVCYNINKEHILLDKIPAALIDEMTPSP